MKILIINFEYPPLGGGGGVATRDVAQAIAPNNEVHVLTTWYEGLARQEVCDGVTIHRVKVWGRQELPTATLRSLLSFVPAACVAGLRLCRQVPFDVINAQFVVPSGFPAVLLAKLFRVPLVVSFIGGDIYDPTKGVSPHRYWLLRYLIRFISRQAVQATAISTDTKRRAQELHGVTLPITVIPLGLNPQPIVTKNRQQLQLPMDVPLAATVGRLIPRKGYVQLLKLWAQVPDAHLVIIGDGPMREDLQKLCVELGVADRVHLRGYISEAEKMSILKASDIYVSASTHEGFGIVFLEAMFAGLPIVATNNGGQTDFLRDQVNALLVPVGDDEALLNAIKQIFADQELRAQIAATNQNDVTNYYIAKTSERFASVLRAAKK